VTDKVHLRGTLRAMSSSECGAVRAQALDAFTSQADVLVSHGIYLSYGSWMT
jgi:hypothetical protein